MAVSLGTLASLQNRKLHDVFSQSLKQEMEEHVVLKFASHAGSILATACKLDPMPLLSPCYCNECKDPLTESRLLDESYGWCPRCKGVVTTSWFKVPSWTMGGLVFLFATMLL